MKIYERKAKFEYKATSLKVVYFMTSTIFMAYEIDFTWKKFYFFVYLTDKKVIVSTSNNL